MYSTEFQLPGRIAGLKRSYQGLICIDEFSFIGTATGEVMVFSNRHEIFRTSVLVCSGGILTLRKVSSNTVLVAGGDGTLRVLQGHDTKWHVSHELNASKLLDDKVKLTSISQPSQGQALIGVSSGLMIDVNLDSMKTRIVEASASSGIGCVGFSPGVSDQFVTASDDARLRLWSLEDYQMLSDVAIDSIPCSMAVHTDMVIVGCQDGFIRAYSLKFQKLLWQIVNAHRGPIRSIAVNDKFIVSGGEDAIVRVWIPSTREMVGQFSDHTKAVTALHIDHSSSNIIFSCSLDRTIMTYDLKRSKRIAYHASSSKSDNRGFISMSQRYDSEQEVITGSVDGLLSEWDIDYPEPRSKYSVSSDNGGYSSIQVSPSSGEYIAIGSELGELFVVSMKNQSVIFNSQIHTGKITSLAWTSDEKQLVSVASDASICVW
eukprot:CAMPEP_0117430364 /NCGR_PEP_ID=MMETSP0758-20121206/9895_1 /TAXON_ID=63605 /ORGANISM="Percolomonas cosmopolitus, Strain AE-1 (ATCC 50343)" /LENGTH=430 /DNA_ID=CAMNT_0005218293 /DNA_START=473 /DNA_END=1762 /DNA_ORIENTATION=+